MNRILPILLNDNNNDDDDVDDNTDDDIDIGCTIEIGTNGISVLKLTVPTIQPKKWAGITTINLVGLNLPISCSATLMVNNGLDISVNGRIMVKVCTILGKAKINPDGIYLSI